MNYCGSCYFFQLGGKCLKNSWLFVTTVSSACKEYMELRLTTETSTTYEPRLTCRLGQGVSKMTDITDEQIAAWEAQDDYDYQLISRIEKLEQLCRDLWNWDTRSTKGEELYKRMTDLGIIHETEYDPDTGLKWGEQE